MKLSKNTAVVGLYILAIVAANVTVSMFGPSVSIINAFLFIGLNLTARDRLHDAWQGQHLTRNMFLLIALGAVISAAFGAGQIALASFVAFAASEGVDAITYHLARNKEKLVQVNGSNVLSAAVDSLVFPLLAFGLPLLWGIVIGQFVAKVAGGVLWSLFLFGNARALPANAKS
jgi:uncharacterized PurR-regulated membrane protein YhhQ (DUF165 family)